MRYSKIKKMLAAGLQPSELQFERAILAQTKIVAAMAASLAKNAAILVASDVHPFPIPDDQQARVIRRTMAVSAHQERLFRLYYWLEISKNRVRVKKATNSGNP